MDDKTQRAVREHLLNPGDEHARLRAESYLGRTFVAPEVRFQADLREGGRLWKALTWELQFSRQGVVQRDQGGLVSCSTKFGLRWTHVRIWYPTLEDLLRCFHDDVRISVTSSIELMDTLESLEDNFPGATVVSSGVASVQRVDHLWGDMPKPRMREDIDPRALAETQAAEGTISIHSNPWLFS